MKLKKLMALALSGAMAVSMMTACGGSGNGGTPNGGEGEGVVTGYSSMLAKYMEDTSRMMPLKQLLWQTPSATAAPCC